ncbi:MAG TPA: hypothetical protein VED59_09560 [Acidimicrobiales bacterium]|nr:hypothetical protein [Acidimicrobiales bacterium]
MTESALHVYVGKLNGAPETEMVILVSKDFAVAYACDNKQAAALVGGKVTAGSSTLNNQGGSKAVLTFDPKGARGMFSFPGKAAEGFVGVLATGKAGFYVADIATKRGLLAGRWVVDANGRSFGVLRLNGVIVGNPAIAPAIAFDSAVLHPVLTTVVVGYPQNPIYPTSPTYPVTLAHPSSNPY